MITIIKLLTNPKAFFGKLNVDKGNKNAVIIFLTFSALIFFLWFVKTLFQVKNIPFPSESTMFNQLFGSFGLPFVVYFLIFLLADVLLILLFSLAIVLLTKLVTLILKIKISLRAIWMISVYSLIAFVFALLFRLVVYLINIPSLEVLGHIFYVYYLILLVLGVRLLKE